jgi:tripartite-type tricarboxylate transporter receptor subunit TctC
MAGVKLVHVPYKGSPQSVVDLLAGRLDVIFANSAGVLQHVRAGKLRVLGVTSPQRDPTMPDVPTIAESGVPDFAVEVWTGVFAPAGTPRAIVNALHQQIRSALARDDIARQFAAEGFVAKTSSPEVFAGYVREELVKWAKVVKLSGARAD